MKNTVFIILFFLTSNTFGQHYSYKKVFMNNQFLKTKGTISISDTIIEFSADGVISKFIVKKKYDIKTSKLFDVVGLDEDYQIKIAFSSDIKRKSLLVVETKDVFRNKITTLTYYLKEEDNE